MRWKGWRLQQEISLGAPQGGKEMRKGGENHEGLWDRAA